MKILVTGATGFIGRKLVAELIKTKHDVTALVRKTSDVKGLSKKLRLLDGDMTNSLSLEQAVQDIDLVIHLAAYFEFYNHERPHQALGYRTPGEVYLAGRRTSEQRRAAARPVAVSSVALRAPSLTATSGRRNHLNFTHFLS